MICYLRCFVFFSLIAGSSSFSFVPSPIVQCRSESDIYSNITTSIAIKIPAIPRRLSATAPASQNSLDSSRWKLMLAKSEANTIFNAFDIDTSNSIKLKELPVYLIRYLSLTKTNGNNKILFSKKDIDKSGTISRTELRNAITKKPTNERDADMIFGIANKDNSDAIDLDELTVHLSSIGYTINDIEKLFAKMDANKNGEISRYEFQQAIFNNSGSKDVSRGYFLSSVNQALALLGPIGRISQKVEKVGLFKRVYNSISHLFGVDPSKLKSLGVPFVLSYSILGNISGAIYISSAWYLSCKRTGLSPLVPGQWKSLLNAWSAVYIVAQFIKPFRVAGAICMSKQSAKYLEMTKKKLNCSQRVAIGFQFSMGFVMMGALASLGVTLTSLVTGVPILG